MSAAEAAVLEAPACATWQEVVWDHKFTGKMIRPWYFGVSDAERKELEGDGSRGERRKTGAVI